MTNKNTKRIRRHKAIRTRIVGTSKRPRLSVYRSNKFIYAQIIDDAIGHTIVSASDIRGLTGTKTQRASEVGKIISNLAQAKGINAVVFDRGGFKYIGRVRAVAEAARQAGLNF